ncbi:hypothetical protein MH117_01320 [Paenibacillus sp. ACRRX]|uniref:hypothetical protein n=1 Tax=unclassified Paenibacillus TaxID=185978 RepID=UPI001EF50847|nr:MULTISPECIES: hypothetical protein [unclassified Paenibacillus]MCG7406042.1 hypothetical protein [Paenibacillus sp. ACRRX]MDK8182496.1 hypothetical protein [Paenibacillus sp. UMB4589-SE434]
MEQKRIYVLLTDTGTLFSQVIKMYTRHPMNHASVALDESLNEVFSFGRKDPVNPFVGGFVRERVMGDLIRSQSRRTRCALYSCTVSLEVYNRFRSRIQDIERNEHHYKYNFLGLLGIALRIPIARKNAYFCSQFIAALFQECGLRLMSKEAEMVTPDDFRHCQALKLEFMGDLKDVVSSFDANTNHMVSA